jgi:hypothetical protein
MSASAPADRALNDRDWRLADEAVLLQVRGSGYFLLRGVLANQAADCVDALLAVLR